MNTYNSAKHDLITDIERNVRLLYSEQKILPLRIIVNNETYLELGKIKSLFITINNKRIAIPIVLDHNIPKSFRWYVK